MRRSTSSTSAGSRGGSSAQVAQSSMSHSESNSESNSDTQRAAKPKVIARRPQSTAPIRRETESMPAAQSSAPAVSEIEATTDRIDNLDLILDALEERVMRALERRGGVHRGWF
jgi:hypothetical protein